jgi:hypothetical protein
VRRDERLNDCDHTSGRAQVAQVIVFPARPEQGTGNEPDGRMILRGKTRTGAGAPVAVDCDGERGSAIEG